jgi:hypothetical protein
MDDSILIFVGRLVLHSSGTEYNLKFLDVKSSVKLYQYDASRGLKQLASSGVGLAEPSDLYISEEHLIQFEAKLDQNIPRTHLLIFWANTIRIYITKAPHSDNMFFVKEDLEKDGFLGYLYLEEKWKLQTNTEQPFVLYAENSDGYHLMMVEQDGEVFRRAGLTVPSSNWQRYWENNLWKVRRQAILLA